MTTPQEYSWVFGHNDHIYFPNGGDPIPAPDSRISTLEGLSCVSDANGNLVMYTDGTSVWDGTLTPSSQLSTTLAGNPSSTQSALIVPPAGQIDTDYHIFSVADDEGNTTNKVYHSTYRPSGNTIVQILPPQQISDQISQSFDATERLAGVRHVECDKTWVILQDEANQTINALLVSSDGRPSSFVASTSLLISNEGGWEAGYTKVSPDGTIVAIADHKSDEIVLLAFDNATGLFSDMHTVSPINPNDDEGAYGIEFSPDSQTLYMTSTAAREIRAHTIANGAVAYNACPLIASNLLCAALQLAPNGSIYGKSPMSTNLIEIRTPNTPLSPTYIPLATYAGGTVIQLNPVPQGNDMERGGLPNFVQMTDQCRAPVVQPDTCASIAADVNTATSAIANDDVNNLPRCAGSPSGPAAGACAPLPLPNLRPHIRVTWGDTQAGCIPANGVQTLSLTICNPFSNVTFSALTAHRITVTGANGDPLPLGNSGIPAVSASPIGPYCFGDIAPCACTARQFSVFTNGAAPGTYKVQIEGICFEVCLHQDIKACFELDVC